MKKPINQIAHKIGMQNQYLGLAIADGEVIGELANGNYHSDDSWVDIQSVINYIKHRYENYIISKEQYNKAMEFLNSLLE